MPKPLSEYNRKRDFKVTAEPAGKAPAGRRKAQALSFVIQKHDARNLHYDFRLELDGVLKSWAVPKGPSLDPTQKRLAVHVEDHPLSYGSFEGNIAPGQYGAGDVIVWDRGVWQPHDDPHQAYAAGKLKFTLIGEKLAGDWALVRTRLKGSGDKEQWLLIKEKDDQARPATDYDIVEDQPKSVLSDATVGKPKARAKSRASPRKAVADLPEHFSPQLATLVDQAPDGDWHYEIKFDGYRMLARIQGGEVRLFTRNGHDWTERLPRQVKALQALKLKDSWLDGEVVSLNGTACRIFRRCKMHSISAAAWTSCTTCLTRPSSTGKTRAKPRWKNAARRSNRHFPAAAVNCCGFPKRLWPTSAISLKAPATWRLKA